MPQVKYRDARGKDTDRFTFTLKKGEVEVFELLAWSETSYVSCSADLLLRVNGKRVEIPVKDNYVRDFQVTGLPKGQQNYQFVDPRKGWQPFGTS